MKKKALKLKPTIETMKRLIKLTTFVHVQGQNHALALVLVRRVKRLIVRVQLDHVHILAANPVQEVVRRVAVARKVKHPIIRVQLDHVRVLAANLVQEAVHRVEVAAAVEMQRAEVVVDLDIAAVAVVQAAEAVAAVGM